TFDHVSHFAYVSRPCVSFECVDDVCLEAFHGHAVAMRHLPAEMLDQLGDVLLALAQRGDVECGDTRWRRRVAALNRSSRSSPHGTLPRRSAPPSPQIGDARGTVAYGRRRKCRTSTQHGKSSSRLSRARPVLEPRASPLSPAERWTL